MPHYKRMVTNKQHLVSEQSNKLLFILSGNKERNKNYTFTLCILNTGC